MLKIEFWDEHTDILLPSGRLLPFNDVRSEFPNTGTSKIVLEYLPGNDDMVGAIDSIDILRQIYKIDESFDDDEALEAIHELRNAPPPLATDDIIPLSRADAQALEQHLTEVELLIMEAQNG